MSVAARLAVIGAIIQECGPKSEKFEDSDVFVECGPMYWGDGQMHGRILGPFKTEDQAHNYVAVKIERHRLSNAAFHGTEGRPPESDKEYYGHPMFQYRVMPGTEYFTRYLLQVCNIAQQGIMELQSDDEPDIVWPNKDYGPEDGGVEDGDEFPDDEPA